MLPPDDPLLKMPIPPANADRRAETLRAANMAYREKISSPPQRKGVIERLFSIATPTLETSMRKISLLGGTAVALVLAVVMASSMNKESNPYVSGVSQNYIDAITTENQRLAGEKGEVFSPSQPQETDKETAEASYLPSPLIDPAPSPVGVEKNVIGSASPSLMPEEETVFRDQIVDDVSDIGDENKASRAIVPPASARSQTTFQSEIGATGASNIAPSEKPEGIWGNDTPEVGEVVRTDDAAVMQWNQSKTEPFAPLKEEQVNLSILQNDRFANLPDNQMQEVAQAPISTFSADTDTASYAAVRRMLESGQLPPPEAVRTEEMVNYFDYDYAMPTDKARPFQPGVTVLQTPWNPATQLVHIGIQAFDQQQTTRPPVNLVFLVDVSGSMDEPTKLPLVKASLSLLVEKLHPSDSVALVTYAGESGVALAPTHAENKQQILAAINNLGAGGSTAGAEGLKTAYELAQKNFNKEGVNRILLATDGDFNVGVSDPNGVANYVAQQRSSGIFLSVLGYGMGNYQDTMMQAIAQNGNGVAAYIDTMSEARRVLSDQVDGTLFTVAKDVKFQVEFNAAEVKSYRLLGYETRALQTEDFNNDKVDAGEVGSGHEVTAIYEVVRTLDKHGTSKLADLRIRYKLPNSSTSQLIEQPISTSMNIISADVHFATAVAGFSRLLRHSVDMHGFGYADVIKLADESKGQSNERREFVILVRTAQSLAGTQPTTKEEGGVAFPVPQ